MKHFTTKLLTFISSALLAGTSCFAQQLPPRLIVRSDDMGAFHSVNEACIDAYKNGIETTIE
ncbi:hypothetical protein LJC29_03845, partial [Bacteroides sp. OttesenSCG-928-N06]|nr:hypothetical protein [Bacteroides sp. OttesenSCG-928-N06]